MATAKHDGGAGDGYERLARLDEEIYDVGDHVSP